MRKSHFILSVILAACTSMPQHASRVTVYAEWPSEAPSSMTVVAYGVTLREMSRKTVTGVDTVSFFCPERIRAAIAFPYTEEEWRSLRLSSTGSFLAASVSYGEDFKGGTLFCSGGNFVEKEECHIRGRAFLQPFSARFLNQLSIRRLAAQAVCIIPA